MIVFVVNAAMVAFTVRGFLLAGFFPSVGAAYATYRTWIRSTDQSWTARQTWVVFRAAWGRDFVSANRFGWPQLAVGLFLGWDYYLANWNYMGAAGVAVSGALLVILVLYLAFAMLSWVVRSNFDESAWWVIRMSVRMVVGRVWCTLMAMLVLVLIAWVWWTWPGVLMAFGLSLPIFLTVMIAFSFGRLPGMSVRGNASATT